MNDEVDFLKQLDALLDNELSETEAKEVKKKIYRSDQWKTEYEKLQALNRLLQQWDKIELQGVSASSSYQKRLFDRIQALKKKSSTIKALFTLPPAVFSI